MSNSKILDIDMLCQLIYDKELVIEENVRWYTIHSNFLNLNKKIKSFETFYMVKPEFGGWHFEGFTGPPFQTVTKDEAEKLIQFAATYVEPKSKWEINANTMREYFRQKIREYDESEASIVKKI